MSASDLRLTIGPRGFEWTAGARRLPWIGGSDGDTPELPEELDVPDDPSILADDELETLHDAVGAELDSLRDRAEQDPTSITADDAARAAVLADRFAKLEADRTRRDEESRNRVESVLNTVGQVRPTGDPEPQTDPPPADQPPAEGDQPPADPNPQPAEQPPAEQPADAVPVAAASRQPIRVPARPRPGTLNPALSLGQIAGQAPDPGVSANNLPDLVMTAASDVPGLTPGARLSELADLGAALHLRAVNMPVTHGNGAPMPAASIQRNFDQTVELDSPVDEVDEALKALTEGRMGGRITRQGMEALVAAGGWCAPSEIRYDFFNVAQAPTGLIDLPTIGIRRGGLRWPISLTLADFFGLSGAPASGVATNATMPWEWTETDDISAVTGSPVKTCLRPPCPTFDEARLRLFGLCVLAGNLTDDAYPELIRHYIGLVVIAHARAMNRRHIAQMVAHSTVTAVTPVVGASTSVTTHSLGAAELQATHLRAKFGAGRDAVIEYVLPYWVRGLMRNDLARRQDFEDLGVADSYLMSQFDARNIRVQWVEDWQHATGWAAPAPTIGAATAPTTWPASFQGLMYFPGHFFRGNGMQLNLGVVRDSILNETNDHTAAWSEEATLIGARGPQALLINHAGMHAAGITGIGVHQTTASA